MLQRQLRVGATARASLSTALRRRPTSTSPLSSDLTSNFRPQLTLRRLSTTHHLSAKAPGGSSRGRTLGKPAKYNPPSHPTSSSSSASSEPGARPSRAGRTYIYGGELSAAEKAAQAKKQYPHMLPPEGTWMHWFLTTRAVHLAITITVLGTLAVVVFVLEFRRKTPYLDLLPSWSHFFAHPFAAMRQVWHVYGQHVAWTSEQTQLARERNIEDARKRKAYRVAHGLERPEHGLQGDVPGLAVGFAEKLSPAERAALSASDGEAAAQAEATRRAARELADLEEEAAFERKVQEAYRASIVHAGGNPAIMDQYKEERGRPKEVKKWFGIW